VVRTGWVKVNTNVAFRQASHSGSGGAVIRDDRGQILQASAKHYGSVPDVLMAEALGARDGLLLARAGGYGKVIREVDNLSLVNLLSIDGIRSPIAGIWHEITDVGRNFTSISISFVHREGNEAAHCCAKFASETSPECVWSDSFLRGLWRSL
jgi:hypothetical protein